MNDYLDANRTLWNAWTKLHAESPFYDLPGFKAGKSSLRKIELAEEFPVAVRAKFPFLVQGDDGWWRLPPGRGEIPLLFSLQARKPE